MSRLYELIGLVNDPTLEWVWKFFVLLFVVAPTAIAIFFFRKDRANKKHQLENEAAKSGLALNVTLAPKAYHEGSNAIIETTVSISNPSSRIWCIAAAYISARALVSTHDQKHYTGQEDFLDLPTCGSLSEVRNKAYYPNTMILVGPGEVEQFVRYDRIDADLAKAYPVIVVGAHIYGADVSLYKKHRGAWLNYMNIIESQAIAFDVFARFGYDEAPKLKKFSAGNRYLRKLVDGVFMVDEENSMHFRHLLTTPSAIVDWSRFASLAIHPAKGPPPTHRSVKNSLRIS